MVMILARLWFGEPAHLSAECYINDGQYSARQVNPSGLRFGPEGIGDDEVDALWNLREQLIQDGTLLVELGQEVLYV